MDDFTITTRLTKSDYTKYLYRELYKKPQFILATLVGLYLVVTVVLNYFNIINYYSEIPVYETVFGVFILLGPTIIILIAAKGYISNPSLQHEIKYTFSDSGIIVQGLTFKSELLWTHIIKQKETNKFLILYSSKKLGNFIDKSKMTLLQKQFIKSKVGQK
jgi:hypothetical protein